VRLELRDGALWVAAREGERTEVLRCDPDSGAVLRRTSIETRR
jgi:hypothetical protein